MFKEGFINFDFVVNFKILKVIKVFQQNDLKLWLKKKEL